jgi:hypothetical protein
MPPVGSSAEYGGCPSGGTAAQFPDRRTCWITAHLITDGVNIVKRYYFDFLAFLGHKQAIERTKKNSSP